MKKKDVSFLFDGELNLYEHQSTFSYILLLRGVFYLADLYWKIVSMDNLYHKKCILISHPKYMVFYNGPVKDMKVDRLELKLSDVFEVPDESKGFEWTAMVLNINSGFNEELFGQCEILREYAEFVETVKRNAKTTNLKEATVLWCEQSENVWRRAFLRIYCKSMERRWKR